MNYLTLIKGFAILILAMGVNHSTNDCEKTNTHRRGSASVVGGFKK